MFIRARMYARLRELTAVSLVFSFVLGGGEREDFWSERERGGQIFKGSALWRPYMPQRPTFCLDLVGLVCVDGGMGHFYLIQGSRRVLQYF